MKQKLDKKRNLKEQTPKKRGKKELPVTGILAGVVVILLGILIVLIFGGVGFRMSLLGGSPEGKQEGKDEKCR